MHTQQAVEVVKKEKGPVQPLDPETTQRLKAERVQELLKALPGWRLTGGSTALRRAFRFPDARSATAYAVYVREMAASEGQPVTVLLSGARVRINLTGRPQRGRSRDLSEAVFRFAGRLG